MGKLTLSSRDELMQESPIRKLTPYSVAASKAGVKVYHLNIGQPDIHTPEVMRKRYANIPEVIAYGPSEGLASYRLKLAEYYNKVNVKVDDSNIFITNGGSEAIIFTLMSIASPGDEIIIPEPFYTNYNGFATMAGVTVVPLTTKIENDFDLPSMEEIKAKVTSKTKAIVICNPGNPTGAVFSRERLQELVDFARDNSLYVVSDEVYREFTYDGCKATSILEFKNFEENAIVIDSVSKRYSACGSRVGCVVSRNKDFLKLVLKFGQARLCPPTIDQLAAEAAIDVPDSYFKDVNAEYLKRRNVAFEELSKIENATISMPKGAFYIIAELPVEDADDFAIWMLKDYRLNNETTMIAPAQGFYATKGIGQNQIRIAYILNCDDLKKSITILREGLKEYLKLEK